MKNYWDGCDHEWEEEVDSIGHNEESTDVYCVKCKVPGQKDVRTGEVYWPTT